ncbi:MAG: Smr/MutS family protein, partial [bacterium]
MAKLKLDLHDIFNKGRSIDSELNRMIGEAVAKRISPVEIIPGKGSGQLKKHVLRFLNRPEIKKLNRTASRSNTPIARRFS